MTTYSAVANSQIDADSYIDTVLAAQWRDNLLAIQEGDASAPNIADAAFATNSIDADKLVNDSVTATQIAANGVGQSEIAASAVGQAELKTTTGEVTTTSNSLVNFTLPGGDYGFYPGTKEDGDGMFSQIIANTSQIGSIRIANIAIARISSGTAYAQQRYIQACRPYDLGDGEISRFIFAEINKTTSKVISVYSAQEAPWHYNGPTNIMPDLYRNGKGYQYRKDMSHVPFSLNEAKTDIVKLLEYNAAFQEAEIIEIEITQTNKQADINLIPRPMKSTNDTVIVMLDPVCDLTHELDCMCEHEEFSINELLHNGLIVISNSGLNRAGPPGVMVVDFHWR